MAARDAYHSKGLAEMTPMMSSLSESNLWMSPIFRIWLNIQNGGTWRISFESPRRYESDDVITSPRRTSACRRFFRISLNIQNEGTRPISFESPCRAESDDVITSRIEPREVADFSYLLKYSKWRDVTHIIQKPSPRRVRERHHFPNRTSGCCRFFASD